MVTPITKSKEFKYEYILSVLFPILTSLLFMFNNPMHPWRQDMSSTDSYVFQTVAMMMENGKMPYVDSFDHKGPVIYLINFLGRLISKSWGIWFLEFVFFAFCLLFMYKTVRLKYSILTSVFSVMLSIIPLFSFFEGGNFTEEYAMTFIAIAQFFFVKYLLFDSVTKIGLVTCGICFAATLLLRVNMISLWVVFCIVVLIKIIYKKSYSELFHFIIWFIIGSAIIIIPIMMWLYFNNALDSFWYQYITFNFEYSSATITNKINTFYYYISLPVIALAFFSALFFSITAKKDRTTHIVFLTLLIVSTIFLSVSGIKYYHHYGMVLIPVLIFPLGELLSVLNLIDEHLKSKKVSICAYIVLTSVVLLPTWSDTLGAIPDYFQFKEESYAWNNPTSLVDFICNNTDEDDSISVYGNFDYLYIACNRKHATKYSFQYPIGYVNPDIITDYLSQLQDELPKIIVVPEYTDEIITEFLEKNSYQLQLTDSDNSIYMMVE